MEMEKDETENRCGKRRIETIQRCLMWNEDITTFIKTLKDEQQH
jgi:hypothetical protein